MMMAASASSIMGPHRASLPLIPEGTSTPAYFRPLTTSSRVTFMGGMSTSRLSTLSWMAAIALRGSCPNLSTRSNSTRLFGGSMKTFITAPRKSS